MVQVFKFGQTMPNMKENGVKTKQMVEVNSGMLMVIFTKENGRKTRLMDMEFIFTSMVLNMKATGRMIFKMDKVWKAGKTAADTKVDTKKV